jgi:hypothetical protein
MNTVNPKFESAVLAFAKRGANFAEGAKSLTARAIRSAYSRDTLADAQFLLDNAPQFVRKSIASVYRRCGLEVANPDIGSSRYMVICVVDKSKQKKVFDKLEDLTVIEVEQKIVQPKKVKPLKGEVAERATKAVQATIARLQKTDPESAQLINELMVNAPKTCLIGSDGQIVYLTDAEFDSLQNALIGLRMPLAA